MELLIEMRNVYGNELIYPANDTARALVTLTGRKTFSRSDIQTLKGLGYAVTVKAPEL